MSRKVLLAIAAAFALGAGAAYAAFLNPRMPIEFYNGHTHTDDGRTIGAPQHSGGTDAQGCHNASVPYHCH
jgi:hypothetical protein